MKSKILGVLVGAVFLNSMAMAAVTLSINTQDGQTLSGDHKFSMTVTAPSLVTSVEFYVNGSLRETDSSTPYEFTIDTFAEKEGAFTVRFDAYTENGEKGTKTLNLKVDNGLAKGADFHIEEGRKNLSNGKFRDAIKSGRAVLKIDEKNNSGRMIMARANFSLKVMDLAQKFVEDVIASDPNNSEALDLLAAISLDRAFNTLGSASNREATINQIGQALNSAATSRRKTVEAALDRLTSSATEGDMRLVQAQIEAGRYSLPIAVLEKMVVKDPKQTLAQNWLVYGYLRSGRFAEATKALKAYEKFGAMNGYGYMLKAILYQYAGDETTARDGEKNAILDDPSGLGVKTAQAYLALRRSDNRAFGQLAAELAKVADQSPITNYYLSTLNYRRGEFTNAQSLLKTALLAEPSTPDLYIEGANQALSYLFTGNLQAEEAKAQRQLAKAYMTAALAAKPDSFHALTGLALVHLVSDEPDDAIKFATAAARASKEYGPAHYALCAAYMKARRSSEANNAMREAEKMDPAGLRGQGLPSPQLAWTYYYVKGRMPLLPAPPTQ